MKTTEETANRNNFPGFRWLGHFSPAGHLFRCLFIFMGGLLVQVGTFDVLNASVTEEVDRDAPVPSPLPFRNVPRCMEMWEEYVYKQGDIHFVDFTLLFPHKDIGRDMEAGYIKASGMADLMECSGCYFVTKEFHKNGAVKDMMFRCIKRDIKDVDK